MILRADAQAIPLRDSCVDAIVTDPPYGLAFMGKEWDHGVPGVPFWVEAVRVAKPGAHLVAFGGTRTFHRLTCAIEDAGWEIRDCLMWLYGQGFPKSLDVSKAIDREAGLLPPEGRAFTVAGVYNDKMQTAAPSRGYVRPEAKSDTARQWSGWSTALKPAWEPIILARKPLVGTVAANVQKFGTGGLNITGCRLPTSEARARMNHARSSGSSYVVQHEDRLIEPGGIGRWPANLVLDEEAAGVLDERADSSISRRAARGYGMGYHRGEGIDSDGRGHNDSGGPSRFFYVAKASRSEREAGLREAGLREAGLRRTLGDFPGDPGKQGAQNVLNSHPTVKPLALMRWLCRLVTPRGGLILDPFAGSGTTGRAATEEGFRCVLSDLAYHDISSARQRNVQIGMGL